MGFKRPPRHAVDGEKIYVDPQDPEGFDFERMNDELEAAKRIADEKNEAAQREAKEGETPKVHKPEKHPIEVYLSGENRFQLDAPVSFMGTDRTVREYVKPGAWLFHLRDLDWKQWHRIRSMRRAGQDDDAMILSCRMVLREIAGPGAPALEGGREGMLTDDDMAALHKFDPTLMIRIGRAGFVGSIPLTESEGKR